MSSCIGKYRIAIESFILNYRFLNQFLTNFNYELRKEEKEMHS